MSNVKCPQCSLMNWATAVSCKRCGYFLREVTPAEGHVSLSPQENHADAAQNVGQKSYRSQPNDLQNSGAPNRVAGQVHTDPYRQNFVAPVSRKSGMAIASMVMGIIGCLLTAPVGLILGISAFKKAKNNPYEYGGKGMATAGIVLNALQLLALPVIAAIAIPNFLAARRSANEASAINSLRQIAAAESIYGSTNYKCGDLAELGKMQLIEGVLVTGSRNGYNFVINKTPMGCDIFARPDNSDGAAATGTRTFYYSTEEGVLRYESGKNAFVTRESPILNVQGFPEGRMLESPKLSFQK